MKNFLDIVLTKTVIIPDARNVTMLWRKNGGKTIKIKSVKFEQDTVKTTEKTLGIKINVIMIKMLLRGVNIKRTIKRKTLKFTNVGLNIVKRLKMVSLSVAQLAKSVVKQAKGSMATIRITQNLLMSYGFAKVAILAFIKGNHRERLSEKTPKGEATVRTIEETNREKIEVSFPPQLWSVG